MNATLEAITAAGVVYNRSDFADPQLDGPTAITVTADGRVFGHLAAHGTCHIGYADQCVTPPSSTTGYKYFHQGVVRTADGDLPVGKLTLGTGHAAMGQDAVAAAAHYDNTGTTVAIVRAGEDMHGIYLAGRIVPGTPPEKIDELRRSGVSGDWRGIGGNLELVAALAVNVPGFPVPRTEQLVAAGGFATLVAAGVVVPPSELMPQSPADLAKYVDARVAADRQAREARSALDALAASAAAVRHRSARAVLDGLVASAAASTAETARDEIARVAAAAAGEQLTAAGVPGDMPAQLERYWTTGKGLARWAGKPHPYTSLVKALRKEIHGKPDGFYKGLAANLYHAALGRWPGNRDGAVTAAGEGRRAKTQAGAKRYGVSVGDLIKHAADATEAAAKDTRKKVEDTTRGVKNAVDDAHEKAASEGHAASKAAEKLIDPGGKMERSTVGETAPAAQKSTTTPARTAGKDGDRLEEDQLPETGADGGKLVDFADGKAIYDDGTVTDGKSWKWVDQSQVEAARKRKRSMAASALRQVFGWADPKADSGLTVVAAGRRGLNRGADQLNRGRFSAWTDGGNTTTTRGTHRPPTTPPRFTPEMVRNESRSPTSICPRLSPTPSPPGRPSTASVSTG